MLRFTSTLFGVVLLLALAPAYGQEFQKGLDAYDSDDYATALRELRPLAEQGYADAQNNLGDMYYFQIAQTQPSRAQVIIVVCSFH